MKRREKGSAKKQGCSKCCPPKDAANFVAEPANFLTHESFSMINF